MSEEEDTCLRRRVTIRIMTPTVSVSHHHTQCHIIIPQRLQYQSRNSLGGGYMSEEEDTCLIPKSEQFRVVEDSS
jgi:hypothetical protein